MSTPLALPRRSPAPWVLRRATTKRVVGNMAALSGAAGISYMEYATGQGPGGRGGAQRKPPGGGKLAKMAKRFG